MLTDETLEQIIIRSLQEGVITIECNGLISGANPAALRMLGVASESVLGFSFDTTVPSSPINKPFLDIFQDLVSDGAITPFREIDLVRFDGARIQLSVSSAALDITECIPGTESYVVVFRDITAIKGLEMAKRKAADHLAHELKTPLSIIKACFQGLTPICGADHKAKLMIDRGERNLDRLLSIQDSVEQVFFPKVLKSEKLLVPESVNNIIENILQNARHRNVKLEKNFNYSGFIYFDLELLQTILETLIKNAIENTPDQGLLVVTLDQSSSRGFQILVHDYGVGIPIGDFEFIFEGFHHTQATDEYSTKKPFDFNAGGKGLELFQLKNLCEIHKLRIEFQSQRCRFIPETTDHCPGSIDQCPYVQNPEECFGSGFSIFSVSFSNLTNQD